MITHIVPQFAPVIDGVGDYALQLARWLKRNYGLENRFVVGNPGWNGPANVDGFAVIGRGQLSETLTSSKTILLHYVGYGYHKRGTPVWLVKALEESRARLVVVFHEIWSTAPPWRSVFYFVPLQRLLVERLLNLCVHAFTSAPWAVRELEKRRAGVTTWLPVSANVEPPVQMPARNKKALIFGQLGPRLKTIQAHRNLLARWTEPILVMGKGSSAESIDVLELRAINPRIEVLGEKSAQDAGEMLSRAGLLLSAHKARDICKSSVLMSAFACGCPVVLADEKNSAPFQPGREFIGSDLADLSGDRLSEVAARARDWFLQNANWPIVAAAIAKKVA